MAKHAVDITDQNFDELIASNDLVVVDFWATWCGPCRMLTPIIEALAKEYKEQAVIGKLNVDTSGTTAMRFGVVSIPTILYFHKGKLAKKLVGAQPKVLLEKEIKKLLVA